MYGSSATTVGVCCSKNGVYPAHFYYFAVHLLESFKSLLCISIKLPEDDKQKW